MARKNKEMDAYRRRKMEERKRLIEQEKRKMEEEYRR